MLSHDAAHLEEAFGVTVKLLFKTNLKGFSLYSEMVAEQITNSF